MVYGADEKFFPDIGAVVDAEKIPDNVNGSDEGLKNNSREAKTGRKTGKTADSNPKAERIILETEDLIKQYKQYDVVISAVDRVSLKVREGEFAAIIGSSGSGKSTLLHLCAGLDKPDSGSVRIRGRNITGMTSDEINSFRGRHIGFIFQSLSLIPQLTALENILVPTLMCKRPDFSYEEQLKKLVSVLDIADRLHHLPSELSGGQQQRVAIARALINMPQILFADEPTGNLDRKNADEVIRLLLEIRKSTGQTLVMVTHDMKIAEMADKIYVMENGKLSPYRRKPNADFN